LLVANIPIGATSGQTFQPVLNGHGLFGTADQVNSDELFALAPFRLMACATDEIGMARQDIPNAVASLQDLWDHGETDGYAEHLTSNPLPDTPRHSILMTVGFGDHQVTNWASEIEARTIGAQLREPVLDPGRYPGPTPYREDPAGPLAPVHRLGDHGGGRPRAVACVPERRRHSVRGLLRRHPASADRETSPIPKASTLTDPIGPPRLRARERSASGCSREGSCPPCATVTRATWPGGTVPEASQAWRERR
jgi:hypothetical protein